MKKILLFVSALAGVLFAGSCQREEFAPAGENGVVTFEVGIPENATRVAVVDDGTNIDDLVYAVYRTSATSLPDAKNDENVQLIYQKNYTTNPFQGSKAVVPIELINDQNYLIVFWAQVSDAWVKGDSFNLMEIGYPAEMNANDSGLAAFTNVSFISKEDIKGGAIKKTVELTRPFAQIRIGTTLPKNVIEAVKLKNSSVKVTGAAEAFNVLKQAAGEESCEVEFKLAAVPDGNINVNNTDYKYAAMNYIFANGNVGVAFNIETENHGTVITEAIPDVPVQRNYRTNIVGNLLTSEAKYTVTLEDEWGTPDEVVEVWNGSEVNMPKQSTADPNIYEIEFPSELAWLAAAVNGTLPETKTVSAADSFKGKTFKLIDDVDLDNHEWTPIGNSTNPFKGTFDGNGKTVKNLLITGNNSNVGLFGMTTEGEIKNLVVENAKVSGRLNVGVVAGTPYTSKYTDITVRGHVEVNGMAYVGGVGGKNAYADWTNVTVNVDETSYVNANSIENGTAYRSYVGGVVGFNGEGGHSFKNITSNIDVKGSTIDVGGLFGIAHYGNQFEDCSCSGDVEIYAAEEADEAQEIGGIAGVWNNGGENVVMTDCSFTGNLTTNIEGVEFYNGGLVGKPYSATGNGKLIIDGSVYVASATELEKVANAATEATTIKFGTNLNGNITIVQKEGVNLTINGDDKKYDGIITVDGAGRSSGAETLTFDNINFETTWSDTDKNNDWSFISAPSKINGQYNYSHNVTIKNCTFNNTVDGNHHVGSASLTGTYNFKMEDCTATNMHSILQAQSIDNTVTVNNVTVTESKNGLSVGNTANATITNADINVSGYGIRAEGTDAREVTLTVTGSRINAYVPVVVRKLTDVAKKFTVKVDNSNELNTGCDYHVVLGKNEFEEGVEPVKPACEFDIDGVDPNFTTFPAAFPVATWDEFTAALADGEDWIKLTEDITYSESYTLTKNVTINLNGKTLTIGECKDKMFTIKSNSTIKNGTITGKVYPQSGNVNLFSLTFKGKMEKSSTEAQLQIKAGNIHVKDCKFQASGSSTRPVSLEGRSSGTVKFESCTVTATQSGGCYFNPCKGSAKLEIINCSFNKAPSVDVYMSSMPNYTLEGNKSAADGFTFTIMDRNKDNGLSDEDVAIFKSIINSNIKFSKIKYYYPGGVGPYYIYK